MKKVLFLSLMCGALLAGCNNSNDDIINGGAEQQTSTIKPSELFVYSGGKMLNTRAIYNKTEELGYSIPKDGKYDVWYYIRIDGNIPGEPESGFPANQYFPQTSAGKTMISDFNHGMVNANVAWRESTVKKFPKYIFSTDGSAVQSILAEEPTLDDLFKANQSTKYSLDGYKAHKDELHFIWYACKQQPADHIWHVDGILTSKDRTDISQTIYGEDQIKNYTDAGMVIDNGDVNRKGHVEVDVHQQEHKDWNEIKTSIHLRDTVTAEVFLPIDYQEQADDFNIRVGKDYEYVTEIMNTKIQINEQVYELQASITHEQAGIRIIVHPNKEALEAARKVYGDGLTFEIHSYVTPGIPNATIWEKLKNTTCTVTPYTTVFGQITSAFYKEDSKKF